MKKQDKFFDQYWDYIKANEALIEKRDVVYYHLPPAKELSSFDQLAEGIAVEQQTFERARKALGLKARNEK